MSREVRSYAAVGSNVGRHLFGVAAIAFGAITLAWHEYGGWLLTRDVWSASGGLVFVYAVGGLQIVGGLAIQFRRAAKAGAVALAAVFLLFALLWVPRIIAAPRTYDFWGNFFEQFSLVLGAVFVLASMTSTRKPETVNRVGGILLGLCAVSFAIQQVNHLSPTAGLVPKWIPPSQIFWAIATTVAFALAALALFTDRMALLATRLLTAMLALFGLVVWVPLLVADPHSHGSWSETVETFAIAGAAWIFADLLATYRRRERPALRTR